MMNLDPRIKSKNDILTCFDIEKSKQFIGQKGYFTDSVHSTRYDHYTMCEVSIKVCK